jgi:hypothetical protein
VFGDLAGKMAGDSYELSGIMRRMRNLNNVFFVGLMLVLAACAPQTTSASSQPPTETTAALNLPVIEKEYQPTATACPAVIVFDSVPPYGSFDDLQGHVGCVNPADYQVAVYIKVGGWWTKPSFEKPLTPILSDSTWVTDITTGGTDQYATEISAFLVPQGYQPPAMSGGAALPEELYMNAAANTSVIRRQTRTLLFSGYTWTVKYSDTPVGPGPNYFSDDPADVWVDEQGFLHLRIANRNGRWYSTEVICNQPAEHGTYTLRLASRVDVLDKNIILGFFTWDDNAPQFHYREVDIEFSRWGETSELNAQYVIQPWDVSGNRYRFHLDLPGENSSHWFNWQPTRVDFASLDGQGNLLQTWAYTDTAAIPPAGGGNARLNLWLLDGKAPSNGQEVEIILTSFEFTP